MSLTGQRQTPPQPEERHTVSHFSLRWVVGDDALEGGQLLHVLVVQPLDLEVQVHVVGALTQPVLLVL